LHRLASDRRPSALKIPGRTGEEAVCGRSNAAWVEAVVENGSAPRMQGAIEVALISALMLSAHSAPTLGRDTMFAVLMIVLNGVVGLALFLGGLRHREQAYNLEGAVAYLSVIALILPKFKVSGPNDALTKTQSFFFSLFTLLLYAVFLAVQTVRHRNFFIGGVLVALIVFTPEGISALRAALDNQLQRAVNLCLGAATSTIGLTVPAVIGIGWVTGQLVVLGIDNTSAVLLATTLLLSVLTFCGPRTTVLEGAVHLVMFGVYIVLIFSP
jgi:Ca2+:H+ antiporter